MTDQPIDLLLLDRYIAGECSAEERTTVERWVASNPVRASFLESMRHTGTWPDQWAVEPALANVMQRIPASRSKNSLRSFTAIAHRQSVRWGIGVAAALVVALTSGVAWKIALTKGWLAAPHTIGEAKDYATANRERASIELPDGSRVTLNVHSRLHVPQDYGARAREIMLDGEAFFVVQHNAEKPFRVHIARGIAEDLGTEFSVKSYTGDRYARVVVASGEVAVRANVSAILRRGDLAQLDSAGRVKLTRNVNANNYLAWTTGELRFDRTPVPEVLRELERWYDLELQLADPTLGSGVLTANFRGQSADYVLQTVARLLDLQVERHGRVVVFAERPER